MTPDIAQQLEYMPATRGVVVAGMTRTSAAYQAGLRIYDVIVSFNGEKVETGEQFIKALADSRIGTTARIDVLRQGRRMTLTVPITGRSARTR